MSPNRATWFTENTSNFGGGIISAISSAPVIKNTILWNNTAIREGNEVYVQHVQSSITITFTDVQGGQAGITGEGTITSLLLTDFVCELDGLTDFGWKDTLLRWHNP